MKVAATPYQILDIARDTLRKEAEALLALNDQLGADFEKAVALIAENEGRVIVTGIGKSAIIAQKIVATLNSTGTPAVFMHAADAIHGDLGMIQPKDIVLCLSNSGESPEIRTLVPLIKRFSNPLVAMVGNMGSYLAQQADCILNATVSQEACPNNLAPTASTTAQLALGDALAICLMKQKGFSSEDFAKYHPGGILGRKLYLRVEDLALQNERPQVLQNTSLKEVIVEMTEKRLGMTVVADASGNLLGIITDGDLRRMLRKNPSWENLCAADVMTLHPKTIAHDELAVTALELMRKNSITQLAVLNNGSYVGVIHLHDLIREGLL